jgi:hypothetical protein
MDQPLLRRRAPELRAGIRHVPQCAHLAFAELATTTGRWNGLPTQSERSMGYGRDAGCMMKNDDACMAFHHVALKWRLDRDTAELRECWDSPYPLPGSVGSATRVTRESAGVVFVEATRTRTTTSVQRSEPIVFFTICPLDVSVTRSMQHHTNLNLGYADPQAYHLWRGGFDRYMLEIYAIPIGRRAGPRPRRRTWPLQVVIGSACWGACARTDPHAV